MTTETGNRNVFEFVVAVVGLHHTYILATWYPHSLFAGCLRTK
jgi:hypothetical protein